MSNYEVGKKYYMPVEVTSIGPNAENNYPVIFECCTGRYYESYIIDDEPGLLLTAEEILTRTCEESGEPYIVDCLKTAELERDHYKSLCAQYEEILAQKNICIRELASMLGGAKNE